VGPLTLTGIPPQAFDHRLANHSALRWLIDRHRVRTDKRSGIVNDPHQLDDRTHRTLDWQGNHGEPGGCCPNMTPAIAVGPNQQDLPNQQQRIR